MKGPDMGKPALKVSAAVGEPAMIIPSVIRISTDAADCARRVEAERVAAVLARATPPEAMQSAPVAPARGPMRLVENVELLPGGLQRRRGAHWVGMDALSVMCRRAFEKYESAGGDAASFVPPFTPGQIAVALDYQALVEWRDGSPMKCASLEAGRAGGGSSGLFIDSYIEQGRWLTELRRRIGTGQAMAVRRIRPSARGSRAAIFDRTLVDAVCVGGATFSDVLRSHGWAEKADHRSALRQALVDALDRMQGYRGERGTR